MKKIVSLVLMISLILSMSLPALASMEDKLSNHWSKDEINKDFLTYYFPYLAKDDFKRFDPNGSIAENDFLLSFSSLLKDKGYSNDVLGWKVGLTRVQMANIVGSKLMEESIIQRGNGQVPFVDINHISQEEKGAIAALYNAGLISGVSKNKYMPNRKVTQAEAIVFLQRINTLLDKRASIPFKLLGIVQSYSAKEGITSKIENGKVLVTITKSFPTPGYNMEIDRIVKAGDDYIIHLNITPPSKDSIQLQVITYKTITIEIDKDNIGNPPYNFILGDIFML